MLITTYFSKLKEIPDECYKFVITRFPPKWLKLDNFDNMFIVKELSPNSKTLLEYKEDNDWQNFTQKFLNEQLLNDLNTSKIAFDNLVELVKNSDKDVYILCYEKDYNACHRSLIAEEAMNQGCDVKEL